MFTACAIWLDSVRTYKSRTDDPQEIANFIAGKQAIVNYNRTPPHYYPNRILLLQNNQDQDHPELLYHFILGVNYLVQDIAIKRKFTTRYNEFIGKNYTGDELISEFVRFAEAEIPRLKEL